MCVLCALYEFVKPSSQMTQLLLPLKKDREARKAIFDWLICLHMYPLSAYELTASVDRPPCVCERAFFSPYLFIAFQLIYLSARPCDLLQRGAVETAAQRRAGWGGSTSGTATVHHCIDFLTAMSLFLLSQPGKENEEWTVCK